MALVRDNWIVLVVGVILAASFGVLDAFYLATEKRYRRPVYSQVDAQLPTPNSPLTGYRVCQPTRSYLSWSILFFYIPLVLALSLCVTISIVTSANAPRATNPVPPPRRTRSLCNGDSMNPSTTVRTLGRAPYELQYAGTGCALSGA